MVGPAFAGWTVAALGVSTAFWLNGVSFLAVIFSLLIIKSTQVKKEHTGNTLDGFKEGIATLASNRMMRDLILFTMFVTFFGFSIVQLLPAVASRLLHGDASTLGLLMGSSGAGALVGTLLLVPLLQKIKHSGYAIGGAIIWSGFCYFLFSFSTSIHISMLFQFAASMGASIVFTMSNGLLQMLAPHAMRARILSTWLMISFGAQPIAALIVGYLADRIGLAEMVRINGALMMICAASLLWLEPIIRRFTATFRLKEISENFAPAQIDTIAQGGQSVECEES
jgi:MFS family permease